MSSNLSSIRHKPPVYRGEQKLRAQLEKYAEVKHQLEQARKMDEQMILDLRNEVKTLVYQIATMDEEAMQRTELIMESARVKKEQSVDEDVS